MKKENYEPWESRINDFDPNQPVEKQIEFLLNFASLAPSGHNSQPWKCKIASNTLRIFINDEHSLAESDPKQRQLFISFGCFLENLLIAADYYGFSGQVKPVYLGEGQNPEILNVTFNQTSGIKSNPNHLIFQIPKRHSNRYKYKPQVPAASLLKDLEAFAPEDIKIFFVVDQEQKTQVAEILGEAQVESMESPDFRKELSNYVKSSYTKEKFGMPGFALDIPAPISVIAHKLIKKINLSKLTAKKDLELLLKFTPVIAVICAAEDNKSLWLESGKIFERLWLSATQKGMVCSVWAAAVQEEKFRTLLRNSLNTKFLPVVIFRLGYGEALAKPSPRFSLSDILLK